MRYQELSTSIPRWVREGSIHGMYPRIERGRLVAFGRHCTEEVIPVEVTPAEAMKLLHQFNFALSTFYSRQIEHEVLGREHRGEMLPEFRRERPHPAITPEELASVGDQLARLHTGENLLVEIGDTPRQRIIETLHRASIQRQIPITILRGSKEYVRVRRA